MCVRSLLQNAYVFEGDMLLSNKALVTKYQYSSNYLGVPVSVTDDWCFETKNNQITKVSVGGTNCHQMIGISYWTAEDGKKHILLPYIMRRAARRNIGIRYRWSFICTNTKSPFAPVHLKILLRLTRFGN